MLIPEAVEADFVTLLAHIYGAVRWRSLSTSKNPWDIWNHRLRAASTRPTLGEAVSRLANHLGLQAIPPAAVALCVQLRPYEAALLDLAYREHIPLAMRAVMESKRRKAERYGDSPLFAPAEEDA